MNQFCFGKINKWFLFGGGKPLILAMKLLHKLKKDVVVVCGRRNLTEAAALGFNLKQELTKLKIKYFVSDDVNRDKKVLSVINKETMGISLGAPWIFREKFIRLFAGKLVNCHGTYLPKDRGAGGYTWRILRGERLGISLIHQIDKQVDEGAIIKCREYSFPAECRIPIDYMNYASGMDVFNFTHFVEEVDEQKPFTLHTQPEYLSTYWPRLYTPVHGYINWMWHGADIERFICAFDDPYSGAMSYLRNQPVSLKKVFFSANEGSFHPFQSGIVYRKNSEMIFIACAGGTLLVREVINEKKKNFIVDVKIGDRFYTPAARLEKACSFRAAYDAHGIKNL